MNLHCSQTAPLLIVFVLCFIPLWIYITLKLYNCLTWIISCFIPLWIYITLKLCSPFLFLRYCFIPLWIYITLKLKQHHIRLLMRFIPLWIYITLKLKCLLGSKSKVLYLYEFTLLSNGFQGFHNIILFYTSMNLHYSQTEIVPFISFV